MTGVADSGGDVHRESPVPWRRLFAIFWRIGILSFGGPAAQIALMHRVLVEEERWLDEPRFLGALSFCMLLPGPEAMQLATYSGWQLRGVPGGLVAGLLFVVPGALVVLGLAMLYAAGGDLPLVAALFLGIKGAVLIIVIEALLRVAKRALHSAVHWIIAGPGLRRDLLSVGSVPHHHPGSRLGRIHPAGRPSYPRDRQRAEWRVGVRHGRDGRVVAGRLVDAAAAAGGRGRLRHPGADRQFLLPSGGGHLRRCLRRARLPRPGRGDPQGLVDGR